MLQAGEFDSLNKITVNLTTGESGYEDGKIDWRMNASTVNNLVRALSKPYAGAHFSYKEKLFGYEILYC